MLFGYLSPTIPGKKTGRWIDSILILVHPNGWKREGKSSPQPNLVGFLSYFSGSSGLFCISTNYTNCVLIYYDRDPVFFWVGCFQRTPMFARIRTLVPCHFHFDWLNILNQQLIVSNRVILPGSIGMIIYILNQYSQGFVEHLQRSI